MEASKIMAKARTHLMLRQPFFGSLALRLQLIEDTEIKTMATDGKSIRYNPDFVQLHQIDEIEGVIAHEVMHVAMCHHLRMGDRDHEKWNVATDYAINLVVVDSGLKIPECGLLDRQYEGLAAETIYARLPQEDLPEEGGAWDFGSVTQQTGEDGSALTESEINAAAEEVQIAVLQAHQAAKAAGKEPAHIEGLIKEMSKPKVDWRDKLRAFLAGDQPDDYTWRHPNRKFYGTYGIYMPSVNHYGVGHVGVIADVSGSTQSVLKQFLAELNRLTEDMRPESVTVIGCDSKVQSVNTYYSGELIEELDSTGGGGTRMTPAFDWINENAPHVDSVVCLTDLYIWDFPEEPDYPVLWVSTGDDSAPFGEVVMARD
jgi:predicted metal-dependent peptidase